MIDDFIRLFGSTLDALLGVPALRFFVLVPLSLVVMAMLAYLIRRGSRGRL